MFRIVVPATLLAVAVACGSPSEAPAQDPAAGGEAPAASAGSRSDASIDDLEKALAEGATLIDVRTQGEYDGGHVEGAVHLPISALTADHPALASVSKDEPLYVICEVGGRSSKAADLLAKAGFKTVNVQGGTGAWRQSGRPVVK